ncbi:MAG TPA: glycoside hydrolase family 9 protein [Candidatus Lokiarchaeia archaeon]|nr:glycoside hydrolase family 9 protein [Candidatus Lokiarchaeia archaeon]
MDERTNRDTPRLSSRRAFLRDTWGAVLLIGIPVALGLLFIGYAFYENYITVFVRYEYNGIETMSPFGLLDIAHYRYVASEELMGWQFFFGNLPYFLIFAVLMAGFLHLLRPQAHATEIPARDIVPGKRVVRIGITGGVIAGGIVIAEILFSIIGTPQIGLGSHIFIGNYYRDIPALITQGYVNVNNIPSLPQTIMSLLPVACGFGLFFYASALSGFRSQHGMIGKKLKARPAAVIMIAVALVCLAGITASITITVSDAVTGYTALLAVFFVLNCAMVAGVILPITRLMLPRGQGLPRLHPKPVRLLLFLGALVFLVLFLFAVAWPFLITISVTVPPIQDISVLQWLALAGLVCLVTVLVIVSRDDHVEIVRIITLFGGCVSLVLIAFYYTLNKNAPDFEIAWMYNMIIPAVFINSLVIALYVLGFKVNAWVEKLKGVVARRVSLESLHIPMSTRNKIATAATITIIAACSVLVPVTLGTKIFGEHPLLIINNVGMFPNQDKTFFLAMENDMPGVNGTFDVVNDATGATAYSGVLARDGPLWERFYWKGNFTSLQTEGAYHVIARLGQYVVPSNEFTINATYFDAARHLGLYYYYYAKCGTAVAPLQPNAIGHAACHDQDAWYLANDSGNYVYKNDINLTGGYHDSGDYNVYGVSMSQSCYALAYSARQSFDTFINEPAQHAYPGNASIPDADKEAWFAIQWWMKRFYQPEQLFFDSNELGQNGSIRWTVFGPPEYEDQFGNGRWVVGDGSNPANQSQSYHDQFLRNSEGLLVAAAAASLAYQFKQHGYYTENITQLETFANTTRHAYAGFLDGDWASITCEMEMYRLTHNVTYFINAKNYVNAIIAASNSLVSFPGDYRQVAIALEFAEEFNGTNGWNGLQYIAGNQTCKHLAEFIQERTNDSRDLFNFLRYQPLGAPVGWNFDYLQAIYAASYAYNLTTDVATRHVLYDFMTTHFDWLFGRNMEDRCMMAWLPGGDIFVQNHFTRQKFIPGVLSGAFPGDIADGFQYFPGDYSGSGYNNSLSNQGVIPALSNIYTEIWSFQAYSFQLASASFFSQVLGRD